MSYEWDWDGDTTIDDTGCAVTPDLTAGPYVGTVTATSLAGCVTSSPLAFTVELQPLVPTPTADAGCEIDPIALDCGVTEAGVTYEWDWDGDTVMDDTGCATLSHARGGGILRHGHGDERGGMRGARARVLHGGPAASHAGSAGGARVVRVNRRPWIAVSRGGGLSYTWDFDINSDTDMNGDPADDVNGTGCMTTPSYPAGTYTARVTVTTLEGCTEDADVSFDVAPAATPGEVPQTILVSRDGDELTVEWTAAPDAESHAVSRGNLDTLWEMGRYDHAADPPEQGSCDTMGALVFVDPDDATTGVNYYYLVTGLDDLRRRRGHGGLRLGRHRAPGAPPHGELPLSARWVQPCPGSWEGR